ncbi:exported hypothetical protein [Azospirillaceae bacterium]
MRKQILLTLLLLGLLAMPAYAQLSDRHDFFVEYNPASTSFVYSQAGATSTGDQVAVNTCVQKSIQITGVLVGEDIQISIEGRSVDQINSRNQANSGVANWAVLDTINFGSASADSAINQIVDVTEYVDFIRVGIRTAGKTGTSWIDIRGIFTNLER